MSSNPFKPLNGGGSLAAPSPTSAPQPPTSAPQPPTATSAGASQDLSGSSKAKAATRKRKGHRGGKKKRSRRKSFALLHEDSHDETETASNDGRTNFYKHRQGNLSGNSIDSEVLLDHR
jgi:magnesium transporter